MLIVRHRLGPFVVLAVIGATLSAVMVQASAQPELCFGQPATIEAVAGQPTVGTDGDDVIVGTPGPDDIRGGAGDDLVCGLAGGDVILGNEGDDRLDGGGGRDQVLGGKGRDLIIGGSGLDDLHGNGGRDTIRGERGDDLIRGGNGDDRLLGGSGEDTIFGGRHDDTILGNGGNDTLAGGKGDDTIEGGRQDDLLEGKSGNDTLRGNRGDDRLLGGRSGDILFGNSGEDGLFGGPGPDMCRGGRNHDMLVSCEVRPDVLVAVPGDAIEHTFDASLGARKVGKELEVWLVPFPDSTAAAHALAGRADVEADSVELVLTIPHAFLSLEPTAPGGPPILGRIEALPEGVYVVWVGSQRPQYAVPVERLDGLVVDIRSAGQLETPDTSGVIVDPSRALLAQTGLGDVAFDTPAPAALAAFEARFGPPISDSGWRDGCWFGRTVGWRGLSVELQATSASTIAETGRFVSFVTTGDTVLGPLTTADGVAVGMSVDEIMALMATSGFSADANTSSPAALTWWADVGSFGGLAGRLGVDATDPESTLTSIGNGDPNPYFGC